MTGAPGDSLTPEQLDKLNAYLNAHCPDGALSCPVTGERVPIEDWNAPDRVMRLGDGAYAALALTSPAGGVLLLSAVKLEL